MGIHGLMKLLAEECPQAIKEQEMENFTGRKVAIDASMAMYQFLVAVRMSSNGNAAASMQLTNEAGEVTSHIQGMFNRTIKMMTSGIKPVYIFDGKPPEMKGGELAKRIAKRAKAEADLAQAKEAGDSEDVDKFSRRLVKVTRQHNEDCKELLRLMGVPVFTAPCEAESQCAELAKKGKVYAVATEDMDALTFRTPKLLRKLTFSQGKDKQPIVEIDFELVLSGLQLTYEQFVDLCILCGCDYCTSIKGIGPKTALKLIRQYHSIENIVNILKKDKKVSLSPDWFPQRILKQSESDDVKENEEPPVIEGTDPITTNTSEDNDVVKPDQSTWTSTIEESKDIDDVIVSADEQDNVILEEADLSFLENLKQDDNEEEVVEEGVDSEKYDIFPPLYAQARQLFLNADVIPGEEVELKWNDPNEIELRKFLVEKMGFNLDRVNNGIKRLQEAQQKKSQKRLDSFFTIMKSTTPTSSTLNTGNKRKVDEKAKSGSKFSKKR